MAEWWQVNIPRVAPAAVADACPVARQEPDATSSPADVLAYWTGVMGDELQATSMRLKASEYLAKHHGMLIDRSEVKDTTREPLAGLTAAELGALLEAVRAQREAQAIDVTPARAPPDAPRLPQDATRADAPRDDGPEGSGAL